MRRHALFMAPACGDDGDDGGGNAVARPGCMRRLEL